MFSQSTIEQIGYYVYFLKNPNDRNIFYIGKGNANRVYTHLNLEDIQDAITDKVAIIKEIINSGKIPEAFIIRHGLNEETAFEIESTLIDFVGINNITNVQRGRMSSDYGIMSVDKVESLYNAKILKTEIPLILININEIIKDQF